MDKIYSDRIARYLHLTCSEKIIKTNEYVHDTVKFREKIEDCFTKVGSGKKFVNAGVEQAFRK